MTSTGWFSPGMRVVPARPIVSGGTAVRRALFPEGQALVSRTVDRTIAVLAAVRCCTVHSFDSDATPSQLKYRA